MLKCRIIACLLVNDGVLFRTKLFKPDYRYTSNFVFPSGFDEIVFLDVSRPGNHPKFLEFISAVAADAFTPCAAGGGFASADEAQRLLADNCIEKVIISTAFHENRALVGQLARKFGSQSVVGGVEAKLIDGKYEVFSHNGTVNERISPGVWAKILQDEGCGEIFLQSIDRDGSLSGYDLNLLDEITPKVSVPIAIGSGCGNYTHMVEGFKHGATGCSTSNIFHFPRTALETFRKNIKKVGIPIRG